MNKSNNRFLAGALAVMMVVGLSPAFAQQVVPSNQAVPAFGNTAEIDLPPEDEGKCGEVDLTFAIDTTGSMTSAIGNVVSNAATIIATANFVDADGQARLGLIVFNGETGADFVDVRHTLGEDPATVAASIAALGIEAPGGGNSPEASGEAKNTAVNNLPAGVRNDAAGNPGNQFGKDFSDPWTGDTRILVVMTDNPNGGFNDARDVPADDNQMANLGTAAAAKNIKVSDINVAGSEVAETRDTLTADAVNSGGVYFFTPNGVDAANGILDIIDQCGGDGVVGGDFLPIDTTALFVSGLAGSLTWLVPVAAGVAGAGIYVAKTRMNKGL